MKKFLIFFISLMAINLNIVNGNTNQDMKNENLYVFEKDGLSGYMNQNGHIQIKPTYEHANDFYNGMAVVGDKSGFKGVIDKNGDIVIPFEYQEILNISDDVFLVYLPMIIDGKPFIVEDGYEKRFTYVNKEGELLFDKCFYDANSFHDGLAAVHKYGRFGGMPPSEGNEAKWTYINKTGE